MLHQEQFFLIDGKSYSKDNFSEVMEGQVTSIRFADYMIGCMETEINVMVDARREIVASLRKIIDND